MHANSQQPTQSFVWGRRSKKKKNTCKFIIIIVYCWLLVLSTVCDSKCFENSMWNKNTKGKEVGIISRRRRRTKWLWKRMQKTKNDEEKYIKWELSYQTHTIPSVISIVHPIWCYCFVSFCTKSHHSNVFPLNEKLKKKKLDCEIVYSW